MDLHFVLLRGTKKNVIENLLKMKSLLYENPQSTLKLNINEVDKKLNMVNNSNLETIGSMIVILETDDRLDKLIKSQML